MGVYASGDEVITVCRVGKPREVVFAFLSNPRNLFTSNVRGLVVEKSDGPLRAG